LPVGFKKYLPKTCTINSGQPLELSCQLTKADARVIWLKDDLPIGDRGQFNNEGLTYRLYLPDGVEPGRYTIRIDNPDGLQSSCQVSLEGNTHKRTVSSNDGHSMFSHCRVRLDVDENERKKPRIVRALDDLTVDEGQSLELLCEFEGDDVEATWFCNGVMLRSNIFTSIELHANRSAQLLMKEMFSEDVGLYKLRLRNRYGEVSTTCVVTLRPCQSSSDAHKSSIDDTPVR
jgi:hypothetical protein